MPAVTPISTYLISGWAGGLNLDGGYDLVQPDELPVCYDWKLGLYGELVARVGRQMVTADWSGHPWTGPGTNLFWFLSAADSLNYLITVTADGLVWRSDGGQWGPGDDVAACETAGGQIDLGTIQSWVGPPAACILNDYFFLSYPGSYTYYWDGDTAHDWVQISDNTLNDSGTESGTWEFPKARTVCTGFGRVWAGNVTNGAAAYPSRLYWSGAVGTVKEGTADPAGPWNWPAVNWVDVNPEDGGVITKIVQFGQSIIIFKEQSMYALVGAGDPASATLYTLDNLVGCTCPGSVAVGEGRVFWLTSDGAYQYDGAEAQSIGRNLRSMLRTVGASDQHLTQGCFYWSTYYVSYPGYRILYDTYQDGWFLLTDGGGGICAIGEALYCAPDGGGFAQYDALSSCYDQSFNGSYELESVYSPAYFETGWLPPPNVRSGGQWRLRALHLGLGRGVSSNEGRIRITIYPEGGEDPYGASTVYTYNLADVYRPGSTEYGHVLLKVPGSPHLADRFRLRVELLEEDTASPDTVTPVQLSSIALILSARAVKHGVLNIGVTDG